MTMTLKQVRDWHLARAREQRNIGCSVGVENHKGMADAIDAHLLSQDAEIERLQSGLAAANERLETTERTLERCKQTLDTTSEGWRLDSVPLGAAERDAARYQWLRDSASKDDWDKMAFGCITDYQLDAYIDAAAQEGEG